MAGPSPLCATPRSLRSLDLTSRQDRVLAKGFLSRSNRAVAWSPDSRWVAYVAVSARSFRNLFAVPAAGGDARALTSCPMAMRTACRGARTAPTSSSIPTSGPNQERPSVLTWCSRRRVFVRIAFAICSRTNRLVTPANGGRRRVTTKPRQRSDAPVEIVFDDIRRRLISPPRWPGCQCANHQPRWPFPAADRNGGWTTEPLRLFARRALARARRCAAADLNCRREGRRAIYVR